MPPLRHWILLRPALFLHASCASRAGRQTSGPLSLRTVALTRVHLNGWTAIHIETASNDILQVGAWLCHRVDIGRARRLRLLSFCLLGALFGGALGH